MPRSRPGFRTVRSRLLVTHLVAVSAALLSAPPEARAQAANDTVGDSTVDPPVRIATARLDFDALRGLHHVSDEQSFFAPGTVIWIPSGGPCPPFEGEAGRSP